MSGSYSPLATSITGRGVALLIIPPTNLSLSLLTEIRWVVIRRTLVAVVGQEGHQLGHAALVNAEALREAEHLVEHLEEQGTGLVDRADHGPSLLRQTLHQRDALAARGAVQAAVGRERTNNQPTNHVGLKSRPGVIVITGHLRGGFV